MFIAHSLILVGTWVGQILNKKGGNTEAPHQAKAELQKLGEVNRMVGEYAFGHESS